MPGNEDRILSRINLSNRDLTSLFPQNLPNTLSGHLNISNNKLTSLLGMSKTVTGDFRCFSNELTSLLHCPTVHRQIDISFNQLTSLEGIQKKCNGTVDCNHNKITSFEGGPEYVSEMFIMKNNSLTSLVGAPKHAGGLNCAYNKITNFAGVHKYLAGATIGIIEIGGNPVESHILGFLLLDGIQEIYFLHQESGPTFEAYAILSKYMRGNRDVIECQQELIDAGLKRYAQL